MADIQQEKYMQDILQHDFDVWYETAVSYVRSRDDKHAVYALNCLDAIISMQDILGFDEGGGYYDMDRLDVFILNDVPAEVLCRTTFYDDERGYAAEE